MNMKKIQCKPIGIIHTPFKNVDGMTIQPRGAKGINGTVKLFTRYTKGLQDIDGFSHIILLYHLHLSKGPSLKVTPFLADAPHGIFATRSPRRPNPIGISLVRLVKKEKNILHIKNVDIVDGTPLLDIKPYVPEFDEVQRVKIGWLSANIKNVRRIKSDKRFNVRLQTNPDKPGCKLSYTFRQCQENIL